MAAGGRLMNQAVKKIPCFWLTGMSGVGKTTLAKALAELLRTKQIACKVLDGDELRHSISADLGFSEADRHKSIQRAADLAFEQQQLGIIPIVSMISPYREARNQALARLHAFEVYVDAPLAVLTQRDPKGLYAKALAGEIENFTGISAVYEPPLMPTLHLRTDRLTVQQCLSQLYCLLN